MFSAQTESKAMPKEAEILRGFERVWLKSFSEILADMSVSNIEKVIHEIRTSNSFDEAQRKIFNLPGALAPFHFHLHMRKNFEENEVILENFLKNNSEAKQTEKSFTQKSVNNFLYDCLQDYLRQISINPAELSEAYKNNLINTCILLQKKFAANEEDHVFPSIEYYFISFSMDGFDIWAMRYLTNRAMFNNGYTLDHDPIHFDAWQELNPNYLYRHALALDFTCGPHDMDLYDNKIIFFYKQKFKRECDLLTAMKYYRLAATLGLEVALTGMARMYAQGKGGVEKDIDFAVHLYRMALQRGVVGAVPVDSDDPRIIYYSVMLSGRSENFRKYTKLRGFSYIETDCLLRMNDANSTLNPIFDKFKKLADENPDNIFDSLLDCDKGSLDRLKYCLDDATLKKVLHRKEKFYVGTTQILAETAKFPLPISKLVFSFFCAEKEYYTEQAAKKLCVIM